jgi:type I restriction enzyme M protein
MLEGHEEEGEERMNEKISQQEINNVAWAACDTFRGVVDPAQYKDYILVMLFLKYISDVWQDHYEEYRKQYGDDEERIRRRLDRERFVLPKGASFYDLYEQRNEPNIGELINIALDAIEESNKAKLEGVFRNIDFNNEANLGKTKDRNRILKNLLDDLDKPQLDMRPSRVSEDIIGNTYIYLIEKFASDAGKKAGEFYTPYKVSELLAKLARPKPGDRICDPTCGSGGLLVEAAREVGGRDFALFGMEVNGSTWALARMNMFLHGLDGARIEWCNTLTNPALVENDRLMKFNVVVANPPFSLDKWGAAETDRFKRFWRGIPPKSKGDYAFISHMIEAALEKEGRVAVVAPHGVLFRGGSEGRIRQKLIEENLLDAVVGLPANLFPTTSIPVAILVFDRSREKGGANETRREVIFIDASRDYQSAKTRNLLLEEHLARIVDTYRTRRDVDKYAHVAAFEEIKENDFNLNIPRYVDTFEEEEEIDIAAVQRDIERIEGELAEVKEKIKAYLAELGVTEAKL